MHELFVDFLLHAQGDERPKTPGLYEDTLHAVKKHLNTLYITSENAYLSKERETFVVEVDHEKVFQAPIHSIENIVCFGFKMLTPALMASCAENNVGVSFLSETGRFLARVSGPQKGNVLLRKAQYAIADSELESLKVARPIVAAKVANYRNLLMRHERNIPMKPQMQWNGLRR